MDFINKGLDALDSSYDKKEELFSKSLELNYDSSEKNISSIINLLNSSRLNLLLSSNLWIKNTFILKLISERITYKQNINLYKTTYSSEEWAIMFLARETGISLDKINNKLLSDNDWKCIARTISKHSGSNLLINALHIDKNDVVNFDLPKTDTTIIIDDINSLLKKQVILDNVIELCKNNNSMHVLVSGTLSKSVLKPIDIKDNCLDEQLFDNIIFLEELPPIYDPLKKVQEYFKVKVIKAIDGYCFDSIFEYDKECLKL